MEISRNQYYLAGIVLLLLGLQFRLIEAVDLNPRLAKMMTEHNKQPLLDMSNGLQSVLPTNQAGIGSHYAPPEWWGWMLVSIGSVLVLHSWALPKAG